MPGQPQPQALPQGTGGWPCGCGTQERTLEEGAEASSCDEGANGVSSDPRGTGSGNKAGQVLRESAETAEQNGEKDDDEQKRWKERSRI